jgi:hypothetical protein
MYKAWFEPGVALVDGNRQDLRPVAASAAAALRAEQSLLLVTLFLDRADVGWQ